MKPLAIATILLLSACAHPAPPDPDQAWDLCVTHATLDMAGGRTWDDPRFQSACPAVMQAHDGRAAREQAAQADRDAAVVSAAARGR